MLEDRNNNVEPQTREIIRIGAGGSRSINVTQRTVEYVGLAGELCTLDLQECARNWVRWHRDHSDEFIPVTDASPADIDDGNARCVGTRGACDNPPWVEFMNERRTRFEFDSYEAIYREILGPISRHRWQTFDTG